MITLRIPVEQSIFIKTFINGFKNCSTHIPSIFCWQIPASEIYVHSKNMLLQNQTLCVLGINLFVSIIHAKIIKRICKKIKVLLIFIYYSSDYYQTTISF